MNEDLIEAINDLTRVTIALSGKFASKSDAIRSLHELSIPSGRIAALLGMKTADVSSLIAKIKKDSKSRGKKRG